MSDISVVREQLKQTFLGQRNGATRVTDPRTTTGTAVNVVPQHVESIEQGAQGTTVRRSSPSPQAQMAGGQQSAVDPSIPGGGLAAETRIVSTPGGGAVTKVRILADANPEAFLSQPPPPPPQAPPAPTLSDLELAVEAYKELQRQADLVDMLLSSFTPAERAVFHERTGTSAPTPAPAAPAPVASSEPTIPEAEPTSPGKTE